MVAVTGPAPGSELTAEADEVEERSSAGVLHVAAIFASHMVLQRNKPNAVFGALDADCAGMEVVAQIRDFDGSMVAQAHAYASKDLKDGLSPWRVMLPAQPEGGPYTLRVTAGNDFLEFEDVLIGEVWLAGGQSNMELELRNSENAEAALENCADPLLRFYNVPKTGVINRNAENAASWQESSPENSGVMSAVAYYFAHKLRSELDPDLPIGIVDCYIGGHVDHVLDERGRVEFQRGRTWLSHPVRACDRRQDAGAVQAGNRRMADEIRCLEREYRGRQGSRSRRDVGYAERTVRRMPVAAAGHADVAVPSDRTVPRHAGTHRAILAGWFPVVPRRGG